MCVCVMALAASRKRQSVPRISEDECEGMEEKLQQLRQTLALEKAARSKLAAMQYVRNESIRRPCVHPAVFRRVAVANDIVERERERD